jgi:hypothetical protein
MTLLAQDPGLDTGRAGESLKNAVIKTFGEMAFIDIAELMQEEPAADYSHILSIDIIKPVSVSIYLCLTDNLKRKIIDNIYSAEIDTPAGGADTSQADDCLLEILNVLSGSFLTGYFGKNVDYKLEFPQMFVNIPEEEKHYTIALNFTGEGEPLKAVLNSVRYHY